MKTFLLKEGIIDRLKMVVKVNTDSELANAIGVSKSTISNWKNRKSIDYDLVFSFCEHINLDWLLTGKGDMLKTNGTDNQNFVVEGTAVEYSSSNKDNDKNAFNQISFLQLLNDKDDMIRMQAEEIGRLKERIAQLEREKGKGA
jgi:transcriptional regulator with XRE-family HTH domain